VSASLQKQAIVGSYRPSENCNIPWQVQHALGYRPRRRRRHASRRQAGHRRLLLLRRRATSCIPRERRLRRGDRADEKPSLPSDSGDHARATSQAAAPCRPTRATMLERQTMRPWQASEAGYIPEMIPATRRRIIIEITRAGFDECSVLASLLRWARLRQA